MMKVDIILRAANAARDDQHQEIALEHCRTTQRYLVRRDGGTAHEAIFHTQKGTFLRKSTHQGWSADSTWSRGLAWAIYGCTAVHRLCGVTEFLDTARLCAGYYAKMAPTGL